MKNIELLAPAGDFESLKAAVQNGANAVYFGANKFNARANSKNFNIEELKKAIEYAKLRNVKTHLTLNILLKNDEFVSAMELVKKAYEFGIDAIIVQDLGLAKQIITTFPNIEVHASTQMTTYNLDGVQELENLGIKRVVLARELSLNEIEKICKKSKSEIEIFIHGALCICYSGQCLMSSMIGGRSGNRGTCAGSCRLPYTLLKNKQQLSNGYLLSSKDVCTLDILPEILNTGVKSLKIEGRMKSPNYVGLVTSIYRKYINLAISNKPYIVDKKDKEKLMQIFNRGGFSTGYLNGKLGKDMMYIKKPNHIGIKIGELVSYNKNKGYAKVKLNKKVELGDSIAIGDSSCKISELMIGNSNIKIIEKGQIATIGRIYGNFFIGNEVYKTVCNSLNKEIESTYSKENIKRTIFGKIVIKKDFPISLEVIDEKTNICVKIESNIIANKAENFGTTKKRIEEQLSKTGNTVFTFSKIDIDIEQDLIVPISCINEVRRNALEELEKKILISYSRECNIKKQCIHKNKKDSEKHEKIEISLCLNKIDSNINYKNLKNIENVYLPFEEVLSKNNEEIIKEICNNFNTYIMFPAITKSNYEELIKSKISKIYNNNFKGIVISNISQLKYLVDIESKNIEIIANYTLNTFNDYTINELKKLGFNKIVISPELNKETIKGLSDEVNKELIVYGKTLLMTSEYCTIGKLKDCKGLCDDGKYILKDRLGFEFPIYTNKINCNNLIYNSKTTSIQWENLNINSIRIDILEENEEEIQNIIKTHKNNMRLEGKEYTNGNLNKDI